MKNTNESSISALNDLIEICRDGEAGYKSAAESAKSGELAQFFRKAAADRADYVRQLQARVSALGGDPEKSGSVSGAMHRGWLDMKSAISSSDAHAVLAECERGEDAAVKAYREALQKDLDAVSRELVARQARNIQAAHDSVKQMRDSTAYAKA